MANENKLGLREFLTDVRAVITSPRWRFPIIHDRQALWGSIVLLFLPAYVPLSFVGGVYFRRDPFPGYSTVLPALVAVVVVLLKAGCIHAVARLFEGRRHRGSFRDLMVVFGYTGIPVVLATVVAIVMFLFVPAGVGSLLKDFRVATISFFVAVGISLFVWNMILSVLALRTVYTLRDWKLVAALLIGPLIGGAVPALAASAVVAEGKIDLASMRPLLSDRVVRFFVPGDAPTESTETRMGIHVDRLGYRFYAPERFDLVAFAGADRERSSRRNVSITVGPGGPPGHGRNLMAGRIVGVPGDTVELAAGRLTVNGQAWAEPYLRPEFNSAESLSPVHVGPGEYLVLPEDRRNVQLLPDDRVIPRDRIYGRLMPRKWPLGWWWWHYPTAFLQAYPAP